MQKEEYLIKNACYSVTKYYLCKRNNKRSLSGRKQRLEVVRSFPNRYQFSCINKVTSLFSNRYIFIIIFVCKNGVFTLRKYGFCFLNVVLLQSVSNIIGRLLAAVGQIYCARISEYTHKMTNENTCSVKWIHVYNNVEMRIR